MLSLFVVHIFHVDVLKLLFSVDRFKSIVPVEVQIIAETSLSYRSFVISKIIS